MLILILLMWFEVIGLLITWNTVALLALLMTSILLYKILILLMFTIFILLSFLSLGHNVYNWCLFKKTLLSTAFEMRGIKQAL